MDKGVLHLNIKKPVEVAKSVKTIEIKPAAPRQLGNNDSLFSILDDIDLRHADHQDDRNSLTLVVRTARFRLFPVAPRH
jgi:hypothetical protein